MKPSQIYHKTQPTHLHTYSLQIIPSTYPPLIAKITIPDSYQLIAKYIRSRTTLSNSALTQIFGFHQRIEKHVRIVEVYIQWNSHSLAQEIQQRSIQKVVMQNQIYFQERQIINVLNSLMQALREFHRNSLQIGSISSDLVKINNNGFVKLMDSQLLQSNRSERNCRPIRIEEKEFDKEDKLFEIGMVILQMMGLQRCSIVYRSGNNEIFFDRIEQRILKIKQRYSKSLMRIIQFLIDKNKKKMSNVLDIEQTPESHLPITLLHPKTSYINHTLTKSQIINHTPKTNIQHNSQHSNTPLSDSHKYPNHSPQSPTFNSPNTTPNSPPNSAHSYNSADTPNSADTNTPNSTNSRNMNTPNSASSNFVNTPNSARSNSGNMNTPNSASSNSARNNSQISISNSAKYNSSKQKVARQQEQQNLHRSRERCIIESISSIKQQQFKHPSQKSVVQRGDFKKKSNFSNQVYNKQISIIKYDNSQNKAIKKSIQNKHKQDKENKPNNALAQIRIQKQKVSLHKQTHPYVSKNFYSKNNEIKKKIQEQFKIKQKKLKKNRFVQVKQKQQRPLVDAPSSFELYGRNSVDDRNKMRPFAPSDNYKSNNIYGNQNQCFANPYSRNNNINTHQNRYQSVHIDETSYNNPYGRYSKKGEYPTNNQYGPNIYNNNQSSQIESFDLYKNSYQQYSPSNLDPCRSMKGAQQIKIKQNYRYKTLKYQPQLNTIAEQEIQQTPQFKRY